MTQTPEPHADLAGQRAALESQLAELGNLYGEPLELVRQAQVAIDARRAEMEGVQQKIDELDALTGARTKQQRA